MKSRPEWDTGDKGEAFFWWFGSVNGFQMLEHYKTKPLQLTRGDFRVSRNGSEMNVDAKVEVTKMPSPNFPVETCQDVTTKRPGWLFALTECQAIWYAQAEEDASVKWGLSFFSIYRIGFAPLMSAFLEYGGDDWREVHIDKKGWGSTICKLAPLDQLVSNGVAIQWWGLPFNKWK